MREIQVVRIKDHVLFQREIITKSENILNNCSYFMIIFFSSRNQRYNITICVLFIKLVCQVNDVPQWSLFVNSSVSDLFLSILLTAI